MSQTRQRPRRRPHRSTRSPQSRSSYNADWQRFSRRIRKRARVCWAHWPRKCDNLQVNHIKYAPNWLLKLGKRYWLLGWMKWLYYHWPKHWILPWWRVTQDAASHRKVTALHKGKYKHAGPAKYRLATREVLGWRWRVWVAWRIATVVPFAAIALTAIWWGITP